MKKRTPAEFHALKRCFDALKHLNDMKDRCLGELEEKAQRVDEYALETTQFFGSANKVKVGATTFKIESKQKHESIVFKKRNAEGVPRLHITVYRAFKKAMPEPCNLGHIHLNLVENSEEHVFMSISYEEAEEFAEWLKTGIYKSVNYRKKEK